MKYIRAQNGVVLSVSQLLPPAKGERHGQEIWRLNVITVDGQRHTYAIYTDMAHASTVFSDSMVPFIRSERPAILFPLGEDTDPWIWKPDEIPGPVDRANASPLFAPEGPETIPHWKDLGDPDVAA